MKMIKNFSQYLVEEEREVYFTFGRMNPPTIGHGKVMDTLSAKSGKSDYKVYLSQSTNPKKDPLSYSDKIKHVRKMFPKHARQVIMDTDVRNVFDVAAKLYEQGYTKVNMVVGADRIREFEVLLNKYNGTKARHGFYNFRKINVISAGERDPDSEDDVSGMSASKQRKAAAEGDFKTFRKGVPASMNDKQARELYNTLRSAMNIKEGWNLWEIAPKFDWKNLRENYIKERIFNIGELVENLNTGLVGKIIRRGANHLICVTEDKIMFKSWIKDVSEAVTNGTTKSGVPADQRLVGTDSHRKYVETMVPGSAWGKQFINKYRKK